MISFVVPAHNEERHLGATLVALQSAARDVGEPYEIIVVDDASTDGTATIAREHGARVISVQHRHIAATRNAGAKAARGDVFFFVDADTQANAAAIRAGLRAIKSGAAGGGCAFRYDGHLPWWGRLLYPVGIAVGRIRRIVGGAFLFCPRSHFEAVGGFNIRYFAAEDLALIKALKKRGRFVIPRETVLTSSRKIDKVSLGRVLRMLLKLIIHGEEAYRSREGLELWYGPEARQ
jgi:glycosyltransferase involved in cell wall biosynthesis